MNIKITGIFFFISSMLCCNYVEGQGTHQGEKFEQLGTELATPNLYRTASGAPGHHYWQQKADYDISVELDEDNQMIKGYETITYTNYSPDPLSYLWLQLDQNVRAKGSDAYKTWNTKISDKTPIEMLPLLIGSDFDGGHKIQSVKDARGNDLPYTINKTMMRIDLPEHLQTNESYTFSVAWDYRINDRMKVRGRSGYEYFPEDGNHLFTIAQFFPRMAVYCDFEGWQHKQFLGRGEFALPFGDYKVKITVPADHILGATGVLQNPDEVLSNAQKELLQKAKGAKKPVIIVSQKEAERKEKSKSSEKKTWVFHAENVRDFAWASSRKFIWDAMEVDLHGKKVMAMSYYPKEGNPLWEKYSTQVVAHTLRVYSKHTFDYPYPVAISVHTDRIGMEYPMICFNGGRPEKDGTYSKRTKYGMISVIIHEVGHNFFPMIINSDERQWAWLDEGLNTFLQYLAEQEWDINYPHKRGPASTIIPYMKGSKEGQKPIMTSAEQVLQYGQNGYAKPAAALNILRETVTGRDLFDFAFKEYAQRWMFKHPTPEDFFRTMEDASAVDLDWFWRGWFYSTDHVDIAIADMKWYKLDTKDPRIENPIKKKAKEKEQAHISQVYNQDGVARTVVEKNPDMKDFYNSYDAFEITEDAMETYNKLMENASGYEKKLYRSNLNFYEVTFDNIGGLVMPLILEITYEDNTKEVKRIPAEIWRKSEKQVSKVFTSDKEIINITLDPYRETADVDVSNNHYPPKHTPSRFELFKMRQKSPSNPMQQKTKK